MTISESIIAWLLTYNAQLNKIDTDILSDSVLTYALSKEPTVNIKHYLSGKKEHTEHYQLSARLNSQINSNRINNQAFFEGLEKWVIEQDRDGNRPVIDNASVNKISVSSAYYLGQTNENTSVYSLTIAINYTV